METKLDVLQVRCDGEAKYMSPIIASQRLCIWEELDMDPWPFEAPKGSRGPTYCRGHAITWPWYNMLHRIFSCLCVSRSILRVIQLAAPKSLFPKRTERNNSELLN
jgi:hypothetical protein